jgi:hypothetical protein
MKKVVHIVTVDKTIDTFHDEITKLSVYIWLNEHESKRLSQLIKARKQSNIKKSSKNE